MEDHLRNRHRLEAEWESLCADETNEERASCSVAVSDANANKNRYIDCIPCKCKLKRRSANQLIESDDDNNDDDEC